MTKQGSKKKMNCDIDIFNQYIYVCVMCDIFLIVTNITNLKPSFGLSTVINMQTHAFEHSGY